MSFSYINKFEVCLLVVLAFNSVCYAKTKEANWRLLILFNEVSVGAIKRVSNSYELAWIKKDGKESDLIKKVKDTKKQALTDKKSRIYSRTTTTSSNKFVVIYEYTRLSPMWKGPDKPLKSLTMRKGKDLTKIRKSWDKHAEKNKYLDSQIVKIINLHSAKQFLNSTNNTSNLYFGSTPYGVDNPCLSNKKSDGCREFRKKYSIGIGVRG